MNIKRIFFLLFIAAFSLESSGLRAMDSSRLDSFLKNHKMLVWVASMPDNMKNVLKKGHNLAYAVGSFLAGSLLASRLDYAPDFDSNAGKVFLGCCAGATLYLYKYFRHNQELKNIALYLASSHARLKDEDKLFSSWRNQEWPTSWDILHNADWVKHELESDISTEEQPVFNKFSKKIHIKLISKADVLAAIQREKNTIQNHLATMEQYSDFAQRLLTTIEQFPGVEKKQSVLSIYNQLLHAAEIIKEYHGAVIAGVHANLNKYQSKSLWKELVYTPGYNPMKWTIAPRFSNASAIYWELFVRYMRLLAVENVAKELNLPTDYDISAPRDSIKQQLQSLLIMQTNNADQKKEYIIALTKVRKDMEKYCSNDIIQTISNSLKTINNLVFNGSNKDTINTLLDQSIKLLNTIK